MKIKSVNDYWTPGEIAAEVFQRTGRVAGVSVLADGIVLEFESELLPHEAADLEAYFGGEHDLPSIAEKDAAKAKMEVFKAKGDKATLKDVIEMVQVLLDGH